VEQGAKSGVLVVGTEGMLTMLAKCCKPAPPDPIIGFVTRGKGVSIHRASCKNFGEMAAKAPERVIETDWGRADKETVYPIDIFILASDRQGLLRDISEVLTREKINVIGVNTQSSQGLGAHGVHGGDRVHRASCRRRCPRSAKCRACRKRAGLDAAGA
jgi:GTP pyrophosphokinase